MSVATTAVDSRHQSPEWKSKTIQVVCLSSATKEEKADSIWLKAPSLVTLFERGRIKTSSGSETRGGFRPDDLPQHKSDPNEPSVCQNLHGEKYANYIRLTMTQSLGGVAPVQRARIIRQLFPYKPFPHQKTTDQRESNIVEGWSGDGAILISSSDRVRIKQEVPTDGNKEVESTLWTDTELKMHDEKMQGWARWEVDKSAGVVRSTKCTRLTTNQDQVCDECREVSKDESFKSEVRKVIAFNSIFILMYI